MRQHTSANRNLLNSLSYESKEYYKTMKNKHNGVNSIPFISDNKRLFRIMKKTLFLLTICVSSIFAAHIDAQTTTVSIKASNVSMKEVIDLVENQTSYLFLYNEDVDLNTKVSVNAADKSVAEVLSSSLKGTEIEYAFKDDYIMLYNKKALVAARQDGHKISGKILDHNGEPVIGATITEKGKPNNAMITDIEGRFTLSIPADGIFVVTYIGFMAQEVQVKGQENFSITLREDAQTLDEVVVVGYGVVKKKDLTGAVGSVKGDDLAARKTTQLSSALQGAMAGVLVTRSNSEPGAAAGSIRVRGVTTIGDSNPLVIVDGVPGDINMVNPNDVESMSVLKDAASASIYGSRAAAGVIVITTKRADDRSLALNYQFEYGMEIPTKQPEFVGIQRFLETTNELRYNDNPSGGWFQTYSEDQVDNWVKYNATDPNKYPITDWTDLILKGSAPRQTHLINLSGGSKTVKTKASFSYDNVDGLYADRYYERFMIRVNNDFKINKYLGSSLDFNFRRTKVHKPVYNPFSDMRFAAPVYAAMWGDGRIAEGKSGNNVYGMTLHGGSRDEWYNQVGGRATLDLTPIEGLKISGVIAPVYNFNKFKNFKTAIPYTLADDPNVIGGYLEGFETTKLTEDRNDNYNVTIQAIANYLNTFGKHEINAMAGYETYYAFNETLMASRDQYELDGFPYLDIGPLSLRDNAGNASEVSYRSWFGRVIYNYDNRYLLQANIRYDGSSRFHKDYRWGTFPSFSAGWVLSEESFLKKANIDWLSFLKVRASWGTLGNERIGNYPYQAAIAFSNVLFYQNGQPLSQLSAAQQVYAIKNISWEKTESYDLGLDAQFFKNRLRFTFDYYKKNTKDMLLALEIPDYVGFDNPQKNTGKMHTNGYDIELSWNDRIGDLTYSVGVNFSDYVSKMGDLGGTEFLGDQVKMQGSEFNEWYGYLSDGLFLSQEDLDNSPKLNNNVRVGDIKYKDISGPDGVPDGKISPEYDRQLLGGSLPRYLYGGNIQLGYKGIDMSMAFQGIGSQNVRLASRMMQPLNANWGNTPAIIDGNYWSSKNTDQQNASAKYPRLTYANQSANYHTMTDYWMFNGRYFRLKNITLGYTLPNSLTEKVTIKNARVYVSANDLFCISKFPTGWDPEMGTSSYPITTSVVFGLSVNF